MFPFLSNFSETPCLKIGFDVRISFVCSLLTGRGEGKEKRNREPVEMAKVFNFQMPVIYVMFKLIIRVASTIRTANF